MYCNSLLKSANFMKPVCLVSNIVKKTRSLSVPSMGNAGSAFDFSFDFALDFEETYRKLTKKSSSEISVTSPSSPGGGAAGSGSVEASKFGISVAAIVASYYGSISGSIITALNSSILKNPLFAGSILPAYFIKNLRCL